VAEILDPLDMGRIQVRVPAVLGTAQTFWAVPSAPMATSGAGVRFVPRVGDSALVAFEAGDVRFPVVLGYFWAPGSAPPPPLTHVIRGNARAGMEIDELPPAVRLQNAVASVEVTAESVTVNVGTTTVSVTPAQIALTAASVSIDASSEVSITAPSISLSGQAVDVSGVETSIAGGVECSVSGGVVRIN
jgi:hypothetical protein